MKPDLAGRLYGIVLALITLTGFGQMPIFKRYYIADVPGLGWLAEFYVTHAVHYLTASMLLALAGYWAALFVIRKKRLSSLTRTGLAKAVLLVGLMVSGGMMVVRNLPGIYFSHMAIHLMNLVHLGLCIALLAVSGFSRAARIPWMRR